MRRFTGSLPLSLLLAASVLAAMAAPASAAESRILQVTYLANPAVVDVTLSAISFDATTGAITVTGTTACMPEFELEILDATATQRTVGGYSLWVDPSCNETFSRVITAIDGSYKPGRVTIEINALACSRGCGEEILLVEAVLVPDKAR